MVGPSSYFGFDVGGVLLSHTLSSAVPSALEGLASGFGMGPGVPHSAKTTDNTIHFINPLHHPPHKACGWGGVLRVTQWMRTTRHATDLWCVYGKSSAY